MRRAFGAPAPRPGKGLRPLTRYAMIRSKVSRLFLRDAPCEHTKSVAFNRFSHTESPNMRKIFCTCRITLRTSNSPCAVRKRKKAQRKASFPLRLFWRLARIFIENPVGGVRRPAHGLVYIISRIQAVNPIHSGIRGYCGTLFAISHHFVRYWVQGDGAEAPPVADKARRRNHPKRSFANGREQGDY